MGKPFSDLYFSSDISNPTMAKRNPAKRRRWGQQYLEGLSDSGSKRLRDDFYARNHVSKRMQGKQFLASVGENDLRDKLIRKRHNQTKLESSKPISRPNQKNRSSGIIFPSQSARGSTSLEASTIIPEPSASVRIPYSSAKQASSAVSHPPANPVVEEYENVSGFMNSIGLVKYNVLFQAEEVDMNILKHMGDKDLKEMGIPMGPRKKILLALAPQKKHNSSSSLRLL